ncbi:tyrosine-type recombinase/integrase [Cupriavidus nantongensis]|uniref:Tyr recombinase domain-containing protein n=1 Tax=Cupriavidus nantongensis TaxID=1796606 RepID=A0A142JNI0_9BURK|nr:tyrosine-type recombinase/integrase [Cupriavidus nantongensis]AMR79642.1 hypothetical protein A2G96_18860 [Cupriavidus nantongensis]
MQELLRIFKPRRRLVPVLDSHSHHLPLAALKPFYGAIEAALTRSDSKDAVRLLFMSGWRLNGALGLRWDQLNLDEGYCFVPPGSHGWKGFAGVMPLSDQAVSLLRSRMERRRENDGGWVFPKRHGAKGLPHMSRIADALKIVCEWAGVDRVTAHDLRRTFASVARLAFGGELDKVALLLGHHWALDGQPVVDTRSAITRRYIQTELPAMRAAANEAATFMMELVGVVPMSTATRSALKRAGYAAPRAEDIALKLG